MAARQLPIYPTERDLYVALSRREERAYQFLYAESFPPFRQWMLANSGAEMDAEDAFQKGLLSFLLNIETGRYQFQEGTRVTTVVFEYCKRVWLTELKSARFRTSVAMPDGFDAIDTTDVANDLERLDVVNAVRQSLHRLRDDCRQLIEWFYVEELSLRDIAQRLGLKETSVKSKRYDCAEKLKAFYQQTSIQRDL